MKKSYIIGAIFIASLLIIIIGMISASDQIKPLSQTDTRGVGDNLGSGYTSDATGNVGEQIKPAAQTDTRGVGEQIRPASQQDLPSNGNGGYVASQGSSYSSSDKPKPSDSVKFSANLSADLNSTSNATGNATFVLNKTSDKMAYNLAYSGLSSNETGAEISIPGLIDSATNQTVAYQLNEKSGAFVILNAIKDYFINNQALVRIKTILFPGGEISGQIRII